MSDVCDRKGTKSLLFELHRKKRTFYNNYFVSLFFSLMVKTEIAVVNIFRILEEEKIPIVVIV